MLAPKSDDGIYRILLLTNRDSDNGGDQVIEACALSLIKAALENLELANYKILSRAAGIVPRKYVETRDPSLLEGARKLIDSVDLIIFGGAPLFNYRYQVFYERTATTLEIAEECGTPVVFSSIGVEGYDQTSPKCLRLKKTLNLHCVKQITTRDDFNSLKKYISSDHVAIRKVSDPAVLTGKVFENFIAPKAGKCIGIFVIRANAFVDNKIKFSRDDAIKLWLDLIAELENRGLDYELLTSGHFGDEAFLDKLIRVYGVNPKKCVFNMNSPEKLIEKISSYDAIVSCRLHPSIISYALGVPSAGIVWNSKVEYFYDAIGYPDRIISTKGISGESVANKIESIIKEGVMHDEEYILSVYDALLNALRRIIVPECNITPYDYKELLEKLPVFTGTSKKEQAEKIKRKFRRTYGKYNDLSDKNRLLKQEIKQLKKRINELEGCSSYTRRIKSFAKHALKKLKSS